MHDQDKSKAQLIHELEHLRQRVAELEARSATSRLSLTTNTLAEKHELLSMVFDHLPVQVYAKDRQSRFMLANAAALKNLQVDALEECLGKTDLELFAYAPDMAARFFAEEQAIMESGEPILKREEVGFTKEGTPQWAVINKLPLRDASGTIIGLVGINMDITERKQAQQALAEERNLLNTVLDQLPAQVYVKDTEGRFLLANLATLHALKITSLEACIGKTDLELLAHVPDLAAGHFAEEQSLMQTGEPILKKEDAGYNDEGILIWDETSKMPLRDSAGNIIGLIGFNIDITGRKQAQQALAEERNLLNTVLDHLPAQVYVKDLASRFILANAAARTGLHAATPADYLGKTDFDLLPHAPEKAEAYFAEEQAIMQTGQAILNKEHTSITREGETLWTITSKLPMHDIAGNITGMVGIGIDITERKLIQQALAEERNLLMTVLDYLPAQVYVKDLESRFTLANAAAMASLRAATPADYRGKTDFELIPQAPDNAADYIAEEQAIIQTGQPLLNKEHTSGTRDGEVLWMITSKLPMRDIAGNITGLVGIGMDITERKRAEEAYRNLVDHSLQGLAIFQDSKIVFCNQQYAAMRGYTLDELLSQSDKNIFDNIHPEDRAKVQAYAKARLQGKHAPKNYEMRIIKKDGEFRWFESYHILIQYGGKPAVQSMFIDITERKQAEQDLQESEARYRALAQATMEGIGIVEQGVLIDANEYFAKMLGYTLDEIIGQPMRKLIVQEDHDKVREKVNNNFVGSHEYRMVRKDGTILSVETHGRNILYRGRPARIAVIRDITKRQQAEAERLALALEHERVSILANFIRDVSHEFRTPLTVLNTCLYLLERSNDPKVQAEQFQILRNHLHYIENLVEAMLTMANLDAGIDLAFMPTDINTLLWDIVQRIQGQAQIMGVTFNFEPSDDLPPLQGNQQALHRMMLNLINNAIQYTPPGGKVTVQTCVEEDQIVVEVIDTGQGITPDNFQRIFERFYRIDQARSERRAGLGLSIAQKIAEIHSGRITVQSKIDEGSTFRVFLPLTDNH